MLPTKTVSVCVRENDHDSKTHILVSESFRSSLTKHLNTFGNQCVSFQLVGSVVRRMKTMSWFVHLATITNWN